MPSRARASSSRWASCAASIPATPRPSARSRRASSAPPVVFKSTSRDPHRTSLEYADPRSSGGMILDMGIHDFDLARFFMGEVQLGAHRSAGTLAFPELKTVGDIDNAVVSLVFADGRLGVVDLSRNGIYGYDITTELLGTAGHAAHRLPARDAALRHDARTRWRTTRCPTSWSGSRSAYTLQLQDFARNVLENKRPARDARRRRCRTAHRRRGAPFDGDGRHGRRLAATLRAALPAGRGGWRAVPTATRRERRQSRARG